MKNIFSYAIAFMSMVLFTACPSDDDEDFVPDYNSSSVSRKFWGGWFRHVNNGTTSFLFWDNGKMYYYHTNQNSNSNFSWNYNESTGILATTASEYQWEITLCDSTAWTGIALYGSHNTVTFSREGALNEARIVLNERNWINTSDDSEWTPEPRNGYFLMRRGNIQFNIIPNYLVKAEESFSQDKIFIRQFKNLYAYNNDDLNKVNYECIISHPYSYKNVRVSCKWAPDYNPNYGDDYHTDLNLRPQE